MRLSQRNIDVGQRIVSLYLTRQKEGVIENAIDCQSELYSHCALKQYPFSAHATLCRRCRNLRSPTPMVESEHEHPVYKCPPLPLFLFFFPLHPSPHHSLTHPHPQSSRPKKQTKTPKQSQASAGTNIPKTSSSNQTQPNPTQSRTNLKNDPLRRLDS